MNRFVYLKPALSFIMIFIGIKMALVGSPWEIPTWFSLCVILFTMTAASLASLYKEKQQLKVVNK
ncbi:integral membrane protein TerC [Vibrio maritimus]|uniref:Integral membrane protein TerC n=1 Tax=Vibrio maritimus TaxID=990268 RepID=A0A090SWN9_9VIBR|nr:integral membrane protein TerC [Vibrio maritimus]